MTSLSLPLLSVVTLTHVVVLSLLLNCVFKGVFNVSVSLCLLCHHLMGEAEVAPRTLTIPLSITAPHFLFH